MKRGIKTIVTVHEYWWLCPHRVMVDYNRKICEGPKDINKCGFCISQTIQTNKYGNGKFKKRLKTTFPILVRPYKKFRSKIVSNEFNNTNVDLSFGNMPYKVSESPVLVNSLKERLRINTENLNNCSKIIAVSTDVKNKLEQYGVNPDKIVVQHIGSTIANKCIPHRKTVNNDEIVFGYIGGVGYYKGVHQLIEAFLLLPDDLKNKARIEIWGKGEPDYISTLKKIISKDNQNLSQIAFKGAFTPTDIPIITNRIDVSVLPSLCADTAPQTIFESFSAGLPIIAPNVGGFVDFVEHNINGLIYEAANVQSLSLCLREVIENPSILDSLRINIPVLKNIQQNVVELLNLYAG